ncbi:MAG: hypothetical protein WCW16_00265 [Candidatus Magasanikbacteria bacterium]
MKNKYVIIVPAVAIALLALGGTAKAFGGFGMGMISKIDPAKAAEQFQTKMDEGAQILGITADEMKGAWAQGKNIHDLAKEKGISDEDLKTKMQALRQEEMKQWFSTLVSQGIITQAQADQRLTYMSEHKGNMGENMKGGRRGMGKMMQQNTNNTNTQNN